MFDTGSNIIAPLVPHPSGDPRVKTATTFPDYAVVVDVVDFDEPGLPPLVGADELGTLNLTAAPSGSAPGYSYSHVNRGPQPRQAT